MFTSAKKDAPVNTPSPSGSQPQAFNSASIMTRSQLEASVRTPRTPSIGLPITGRGPAASPVMVHHEDSPYTTPRIVATVNITSTSQGPEVTIVGSRGGQYLPTKPMTYIENVDVREYHSDSKREHTTITEWRAQVESWDRHWAALHRYIRIKRHD